LRSAATVIDRGPLVRLVNVSKWFGDFQALRSVSLDAAQGDRIVFCGPSGSGKSTLIRCINALERADEGSIVVDGIELRDTSDVRAVRREVGMVFQQFNLFPHLTVLENLILAPMKVRGHSRDEATGIAREHLQRVRIPEQAHKYPNQLSGGQQQRVAIARALCMRPKIMLFDEPTSALDPEMVNEVLDAIMDLARDGMTIFCVTHEMSFARRMASRVVFMERGELIESSPPDEFFAAPRSERLKAFLTQVQRGA
jgi:ABC-type polar amino acid transport system ATPase subunit